MRKGGELIMQEIYIVLRCSVSYPMHTDRAFYKIWSFIEEFTTYDEALEHIKQETVIGLLYKIEKVFLT